MTDSLVTQLLPILGRSLEQSFNVFDVMHHGTHEKQLSNVFAWLLDRGGTHELSDAFVRIFIGEVNRAQGDHPPIPHGRYRVHQEVNTAWDDGGDADIADLVLESSAAVVVVENYYTSDGHGHSFERYWEYSVRDARQGAVVLLCRDEDRARLSAGWENACVVTYSALIERLYDVVNGDPRYQRTNPEVASFIEQMHRKFVTERGLVDDRDVLSFVTAMCDTGEAHKYQWKGQDAAAEQFASEVAVQARQRFGEGRDLLQRIKKLLRDFSAGPLKDQLNSTLGEIRIPKVSATYAGIYQWTINFDLAESDGNISRHQIQLKFGPSAWFAIERDQEWKRKVDPDMVAYSRLFVTRLRTKEIRQSTVALHEVLDGLDPGDRRLHDEIVQLLGDN